MQVFVCLFIYLSEWRWLVSTTFPHPCAISDTGVRDWRGRARPATPPLAAETQETYRGPLHSNPSRAPLLPLPNPDSPSTRTLHFYPTAKSPLKWAVGWYPQTHQHLGWSVNVCVHFCLCVCVCIFIHVCLCVRWPCCKCKQKQATLLPSKHGIRSGACIMLSLWRWLVSLIA